MKVDEPIETDKRLLCPDCRLPMGEKLHPELAAAINAETPEDFPKMCECDLPDRHNNSSMVIVNNVSEY